jgi:hypothetical protein
MFFLQLLFQRFRFFNDFGYGYRHIWTHDAACCTKNAVIRARLIYWEIAHGIDFFGYFQNILWANRYTQSAPFASVIVDNMSICHIL